MNGGAIVLPVLHETIPVNMNTLKLEVRRANDQALITKDRMRVDVLAEFYVRVQPTQESIANAAQTLGIRTMEPSALKELVEGKFVDALRAVAAEMAMEDLHEQRVSFVQKVQAAVSEDLLKNGLELESVSLTGLDQTNRDFFNPDNAFDAEGLTKLTQEIEERRKKRNDIEQETEVLVRRKNLEAEQQKLEIERDTEYAKLAQEREVAIRKAAQMAEVAGEEAERMKQAETAKIVADQSVKQAEITSSQAVEQQRIQMDQEIREREIVKSRTVDTAEVDKLKSVELAEQDRAIAIADKSREQSNAQAEADAARALAVRAEEEVATVREVQTAERQKQVQLVQASREAERQAIAITVAAEADRTAADDRAEAARLEARGEADRTRIGAEGDAQATRLRAEAAEVSYAAEAEGQRALNEAANLLNREQIALRLRLALIEALPRIIEESAKPMERIDGIKILQVAGLGGGNGSGGGSAGDNGAGAGEGSLADQLVNSALRYRAQAPLLDSLMADLGLEAGDLNGLTRGLVKAAGGGENEGGGEAS